MWRPRPIAADLTVEQLLAHIRSGIDLDQLTFMEGNITYWNFWNIDRSANPQFYTNLSDAADNNYKPPHHKDSETTGEEEEKEENPLPIPGPSHPLPTPKT